MIFYYILVIVGVLLASVSQILLKKSASVEHSSIITEYLNVRVIFGYGLLTLSLGLDLWALHFGVQAKEVSSIEALSYLFVPVLSWFVFKEKISKTKAIAIGLIIGGVVVFFV